jgi:DNA-binding protein HU-beta
MTKTDLVSQIAENAGISQKAAALVVKAVVGAVQESLKGEEAMIRIPDLGTFKVSKRSARTGVNPRTGEKINIPETVVPGFSAAKALKDSVKG